MTQTFYFLRHGQTEANQCGLMCGGNWDICLTELGKEQAIKAALRLKDIGIRTIVHSPLKRAVETATLVANELARDRESPRLVEEEWWREWILGDWERRPFVEVSADFLSDKDAPGGEKRADLERRVEKALDKSLALPGPILVVAHGGVWLALARILNFEAKRILNGIPLKLKRNSMTDTTRWEFSEISP